MNFAEGDAVEVKVGSGLGRWVPGVIAGLCGYGRGASYTVKGFGEQCFGSSKVRRGRSSQPAKVPPMTRAPRKTRKRMDNSGRGPLRYDGFRRWVKTRPCIFCGGKADDPHHYGPKGTGQTTDDTRIVPVCRKAHDACHHRRPDELCSPGAYIRLDPDHSWAVIEAHIFRWQVNLLTEYLRYHGGQMS